MKNMYKITQERLKEVLKYDANTGEFRWRIGISNVSAGSLAGRVSMTGSREYRYIRIDNEEYTAHRLAWFYVKGEWPSAPIRPLNGNTLDCRVENWRMSRTVNKKGLYMTDRKAYNREHRKAHPEYYRDVDLRRTFGITAAQYDEMLVEQNGVCAICEQPEKGIRNGKPKMLAVDHDHVTNEIRQLLCSCCNPMLGYAGDQPEILRKAAAYLERHKTGKPDNVVRLTIVKGDLP